MIETLAAAAESMQGVLQGEDREFRGINTDTRAVHSDALFFALQGPNFDGHDYVAAAATKAAAGAVVSRHQDIDIPQIEVDDVRRALGRFGAAWRDAHDVTVVGITGSNGKTTLKELIAACLSLEAPTLATKGNLNNDIGVPLMLARIDGKSPVEYLNEPTRALTRRTALAMLDRPHDDLAELISVLKNCNGG